MVASNQVVIDGRLLKRGVLRHTPAGVAALDLTVEHASEQVEAGKPRKVQCKVDALALGDMAVRLNGLKANQKLKLSGFLTQRALNDTQLVVHVTDAEIQG